MIELNQNQLRFSFPSLDQELRGLARDYADTVLPAILSEDRLKVLGEFLKRDYRRHSEPDRRRAEKEVLALSDERIREEFRDQVDRESRIEATCEVEFQRTLRLPDDGKTYSLPPGLGRFPLRHVDDHADKAPARWIERGGVMMPMYQAEALWLNFNSEYPFALKVGSGRINAITGEEWRDGLHREPQDYLVLPDQPWLDGFAVSKGTIHQFVAMPLGEGYSVEEQITDKAESGGIQLQAYPMKASVYFERELRSELPGSLADLLPSLLSALTEPCVMEDRMACCSSVMDADMSLGAGGRMRQEVYADEHDAESWDLDTSSRCFVHLCNALVWREITGANPPQTPATAKEYESAGLPWFDYYRDDLAVLEGSKTLAGVKSVGEKHHEKTGKPGLGDSSVAVPKVVPCGPKKRPNEVREWVE